jgi:DNA ligase-associated metallophosphoesterase
MATIQHKPYEITLRDQALWLHPERAIFWKEKRYLFIADPHFGKAASFRSHGIAIPSGTTETDLRRLTHIIEETKPKKLIIIGDLVHAAVEKAEKTLKVIDKWRYSCIELPITLVQGNHDLRSAPLPQEFRLNEVTIQFVADPFVCMHQPEQREGDYVLAGHIHPGIKISGLGRQKEYLPCFYFGKNYALLPAFGSFTGLAAIRPDPADRLFVIAEDNILEWKGSGG